MNMISTAKKYYMYLHTSIVSISGEVIFAFQKKKKVGFFFPYASRAKFDYRQLHNHYFGYYSYLYDKYTNDNIAIRNTDIVLDCGAFVGGFTIAANKAGAKQVISIEPSSNNYRCLLLNIAYYKVNASTTSHNCALGEKPGFMDLNLSESGCDDSLIEPDEGDLGISEKVEVKTIKDLVELHEIDPKHMYLKVEAEGFEPEILKGIGDYKPRVITVDITPERNWESPCELILKILKEKGYSDFVQTERCLFAVNE